MNNILAKIKGVISSSVGKAKARLAINKSPIKWLVVSYFAMVAMLVATYYIAWLYMFDNGKVAMSDLLSLIKEMVGASMVAFITFVATCFIDKDHDDIPDCFEDKEEKE